MRVPDPLRPYTAFLIWRLEANPKPGKKPLKVPTHHDGITHHSTANPAPLLTADLAEQWLAYLRATGVGHDRPGEPGYVGIGFRPNPANGIVVIDLDDQLDNPAIVPFFAGAGMEVSHSGNGLHLWCYSRNAAAIGRRGRANTAVGAIEVYADNQFIALGTWLGGDPLVDCTEMLDLLLATYFQPLRTRETITAPDWDSKTDAQRAEAVADLKAALRFYDPDNRDEWISAGQALKCLGDTGRDLWVEWSGTSTRFPGGSDLEKWDTFSGDRSDYRAVFARAQSRGWTNPARGPQINPETVFTALPAAVHPGPASLPAPTGTWDGLSSPLATKFGGTASLLALHEELRECEPLFRVAHDDFRDRTMLGRLGRWARLEPKDVTWIRRLLLARGYKKVGKEDVLDVIEETAAQNHFDSAVMWADSLKWDGVPRVETAMSRYFATADTPYTRAVAWYLFTALAGRLYSPGCQADMAVILISEAQGRRKSSCIQALVPDVEAYTTADFGQDDKELAMRVRGRLVVELPEMVGWNKRTQAHIRDWVTRRHEQWRGMHSNELSTYPRRFVLMGTGNDKAILDDPTGARRWLPCDVTGIGDHEALGRDRDQLWAEGIAAWRQGGIRWQQAMELATEAHEEFSTDGDPWEAYIEEWLDAKPAFGEAPTNGSRPLLLSDILLGALQIRRGDASKSDQMRAGAILRKLGWSKKTRMVGGKLGKFWSR